MTRRYEQIRVWKNGDFTLRLYATGRYDSRGQEYLGYKIRHKGELIFKGDDISPSPMHAIDGDETVAAVLHFLSLKPGDTDQDYFMEYTPSQLEWCQQYGEELWSIADELEETAKAVRDLTRGGPGHDGYAYDADVYCVRCGEGIIRRLAGKGKLPHEREDQEDTAQCPVPIFFGESPNCTQHCGSCGEYLYGVNPEEEA